MKKTIRFIKENQDGIEVLLIFVIFLVLAFTGVLDWVLNNFVTPLIDGFHSGASSDYIPGETFPY
ncbi:MAG: hypothetical protein WC870_03110 [Candidatus Paceibacterota bacterium]